MLFSPQIQPIIQTPTHGAFPSGHATEAHIVATVLTHLLAAADHPKDPAFARRSVEAAIAQTQHYRLAARIAINRTVAGVHYPVDSAAGAVLGITLGDFLVARASAPHPPPAGLDQAREKAEPVKVPVPAVTVARVIDGTRYGTNDFHVGVLGDLLENERKEGDRVVSAADVTVDSHCPHLSWVWSRAVKETQDRWGS
jgi:hypothetical protein